MPLAALRGYKPDLTAAIDFDQFWDRAKQQSAAVPLNARVTRADFPAKAFELYDVWFDGADGTPVHGWYLVPGEALAKRPMRAVVRYHGYSGDAGWPNEYLGLASTGTAVFAVDVRGQGGRTPDRAVYDRGSATGWMTLGILDPETYYYKQVYLDCLRAIDFLAGREEIDAGRIAAIGNSQGGGLTLAAAGLDSRIKLAFPVYPYLCDFRRAVEIHSAGPYAEIKTWFRRADPTHELEEQVYRTLSYFDGMNHAARIRARTLMAITLQDTVTPPSTCFAAYNHLAGEKELKLYHDYGHEGLPFHELEVMKAIEEYL